MSDDIVIRNVDGDSSNSMSNYENNSITGIQNSIDATPNEKIESRDTDELVDYFIQDYLLPTIEEDATREKILEPLKNHPNSQYHKVDVKFPIILKLGIDKSISHSASSRRTGYSYALRDGYLETEVAIPLGSENPESVTDSAIKFFQDTIGYKNADINRINKEIHETIRRHIKQRKDKITQQNKLLDKIEERSTIKLSRNKDAPQVDLKVKKKLKVLMPKERDSTPILPEESLNAIIDLILNQGRSFQLTPEVFSKLDEESLRNIIVSSLNAILEGGALGETFVKSRRADIFLHLKEFDGNILSAECKFWGTKNYSDTMDQHFDYITIQESYSLQVTFSKNKGFTDMVEKAQEFAKGHKTYVDNSFRNINENYFITKHKHPEDEKRTVEFHHLLFNLFYERQDTS